MSENKCFDFYSVSVVPASPGYFALRAMGDLERGFYLIIEAPIIAWRVTVYNAVNGGLSDGWEHCEPITLEGYSGPTIVGVMNPDKSVLLYNYGTCKTLAQATEQYATDKAREAAHPAAVMGVTKLEGG